MIANVALDYTEWAPPLYEDAIRLDIESYQLMYTKLPTKIIMWVHQWEYLTKKYRKYIDQPAYMIVDAEIDRVGLRVNARPAESSDGGRFMGIKVEVRDPEAHKP